MKALKTSDIAKAAGIHPNTVRQYEELGYLPSPRRAPNGYRRFTPYHRDQVLLIRSLTRCSWLGGPIRVSALNAIAQSAARDFRAAIATAERLVRHVGTERDRAERAVALVEEWRTRPIPVDDGRLTIAEAAAYLGVTADTLRNWDRNGLITIPRDSANGYRSYGQAELQRLLVIRALRRSRYSLSAILRLFQRLDADREAEARTALDTLPPDEEEVFYSTDRWLTRVKEVESFAVEALNRLQDMVRQYR